MSISWRFADESGTVVYAAFEDGHYESHSIEADIIQAWLSEGNTPLPYEPPAVDLKAAARAELDATDAGMARIAEDLIAALIGKGVIAEADIPQSARSKMAKRSELRSKLA